MSYNSKYKSSKIEEILDSVEGKQDAIADLDAIRSGAEKGATALQSIPSEYVTETELTAKGYATTSALNDKVDKVSGKQLSTEDFTTALKTKLEGLSNYDDTSIQNAVNSLTTQINTLVSGDASAAIESFNEIIAFLNGVEDSESLDSIIASNEQQIAAKQDKLVSGTNIKTINGESILGEGNIVVNVDTSSLATKEELTSLTNEMIANEEVHAGAYNDLNTRLNELSENVQGETVTKEEFNAAIEGVNNGISAKQDVLVSGTNIKTINNESILGIGNIEINVDTSSLASKEELQNLQNEVIANEEVHAAALNDLNTRLAALGATAIQSVKTINGQSIVGEGNITIEGGGVSEEYVNNAIASAITNTLNTAV